MATTGKLFIINNWVCAASVIARDSYHKHELLVSSFQNKIKTHKKRYIVLFPVLTKAGRLELP